MTYQVAVSLTIYYHIQAARVHQINPIITFSLPRNLPLQSQKVDALLPLFPAE